MAAILCRGRWVKSTKIRTAGAFFIPITMQGLNNWRRRYNCIVFFQWLEPCSSTDRNIRSSGSRLNIKTVLPRYGDSHVEDKTVERPSSLWHGDLDRLIINIGILIPVSKTSLYWNAPLIPAATCNDIFTWLQYRYNTLFCHSLYVIIIDPMDW